MIYVKTFENFSGLLNENNDDENDTSEYLDCLPSLKKVNNGISRQEVMLWFNENDVEYYHMTDFDMYIYYIEENVVK